MRLAVLSGLLLAVGTTLLLAELRWFRRTSLSERLRPYASDSTSTGTGSGGVLSVSSFRDVVGPIAQSFGTGVTRVLGVGEALAVRLERVHSASDVNAFRVRQLGWSVAGFGFGALLAAAVQPPALVGLVLVFGPAALAFLLVEQELAKQSAAWQRRVFLELPVVAEQLGMLLSAGYSLGAALNRLAARERGAVGRDLARVCGRIRQGLSDVDALREWAEIVDVAAVHELVAVLALNRDAGDLGRLIGEEARNIRREVQRQMVATMERHAQQVWVPVTVATLVPGVMFLAVPFVEAMKVFSGG